MASVPETGSQDGALGNQEPMPHFPPSREGASLFEFFFFYLSNPPHTHK